MNVSQLINEIVSEWAYRVNDGMPDVKNPTHLKELGIVLSEMGLSHIKSDLVKNLLGEAEEGGFKNPALNKKINYKNAKGEDAEGIVGNLLRLPAEHPGRKAAERTLPPEGSEERDALNKDLGGEGQPTKPEEPTGKEGGEDKGDAEKEKQQQAQAMFDPKADPAMGARLDKEKETLSKLAGNDKKPEDDKIDGDDVNKDGKIDGTDIKAEPTLDKIPAKFREEVNTKLQDLLGEVEVEEKRAEGVVLKDMGLNSKDELTDENKDEFKARMKKENKPPNLNLCKVTVPGTNLYCDENKGLKRDEMPQFKGKPVEGKPAAGMEADPKTGLVDIEGMYRDHLKEKGISISEPMEVPSESLKATQDELVGAQVVSMTKALDKDPKNPFITAPIYVSKDGYIVDGHHRWAAIMGYNMKNADNPIPMKVMVIDDNIDSVIPDAIEFADGQGIERMSGKTAGKDLNKKDGPAGGPNAEPPKNEPGRPEATPKTDTQIKSNEIADSLKNRKSVEGETLDIETTNNGSLIVGVEHGKGNQSTKDTISKIQKLPKDTKIMFVGEGGMSRDENGKLELSGEQAEIRDAVTGHFDNAEESSWDENANVYDDNSPVYDEVANSLGGSKSKSKAAIWSNMVGQGDDMNADDYLDDEGKAWLVDQAKKGGSGEFDGDVDWNNLTDGQKNDLYQLNYRDDDGYGETEISKAQQAYNGFRQKELDRKIKEAESNGYKVIAPVGNSHVDMWRQRNKKEKTEMKEELFPMIDSLIEGIINDFIKEANPINKAADVLKQKVKYNDGKREHEIQVDTALKYKNSKNPGQLQAYNAAVKLLKKAGVTDDELGASKQKPKEIPGQNLGFRKTKEKELEPTTKKPTTKVSSFKDAFFANSKQKDDSKKAAIIAKKVEASNSQLDKISKLSDKKGMIKLETAPGSGKFDYIPLKNAQLAVKKLLSGEQLSSEDIKILNKTTKIVTNPENGSNKLYFAKKYVGRHPQQGYESVEISSDNTAMGDSIRSFALSRKLNVGKSSEGAIGKKVFTPLKMSSSINPSKPETMVDIKKTPNGVNIGGKEMKRLKDLDEKQLTQILIKKGVNPEEAKKKANILHLQTKAYNQKLDDLARIGDASGGKISMANFGDVTTPQTRKKTASTILDGITKRFETELDNFGKTFGKENLKGSAENKKVFDTLSKLKSLNAKASLENDEKARTQYKESLDQLLLDMANAPDFKDSVADFAEMKAGLQFLAEGKQVYFPASENFQTADIIVMPDEFSVKPKKGQTMEESIAENLQFYAVTVTYVGGLSVKYKGGGGSANYSKITQTEYKNPKTKDVLLGMQDVYSLAYPKDKNNQLNIKDTDIKAADRKINEAMAYAIKSGIITKQEADLIKKIGQGQAANTLKGGLKDIARCKGANRANFEKATVLHHTMMHLTAVINNRDVAYTRFSNFNEEVSQNKDGIATKITDDIADGVNKPCYMNPHHNPGFSASQDEKTGCVTGAPTNQNPSHIESEPPKNLLKTK